MCDDARAPRARRGAAGVLVAFLVVAMVPGLALARTSESSAKEFLQSIYSSYLGDAGGPGRRVALDEPAAVRRYFSPGLATLILEDDADAGRRGAQPVLDRDPFIGRQEGAISDLTIEVRDIGVKAVGTVSFTRQGEAQKIVLELLKVGDGWRISDIQWHSGSLRQLYRKK
ncbi:MAG TPA: DUF3828 domain-containing protein [Xanthobacteraceae bacterium]|nr:DUF3828 domain-containing protein [Xanthobacteraceae bacterium]